MGIIQKKPMESAGAKPPKWFFPAWIGLLTALLLIVSYLSFKDDKPLKGGSYVKDNKTGHVSVWSKQTGEIICEFYDSFNIIRPHCPDTVIIWPANKDTLRTDTARGAYDKIVEIMKN
jgi:hypothetical protein